MSEQTSNYRAILHWITYLPALVFLVFSVGCIMALPQVPKMIPTILLALALGGLFLQYLNVKTAYLEVHDDKVFLRSGIITRNITSVPLKRVESVDVKQSLFGCLLNYGSVVITGSGGSHYFMHQISHPLTCRRKIEQALFSLKV